MSVKTKKKNLELFRSLTGKTVIAVPITQEPSQGYWPAKVERFWK